MTDPTLRLPNTIFHAVLDLGIVPIAAPPLPQRFEYPIFDVDWDDEGKNAIVSIEFDDGQLHWEVTAESTEYHFHVGDGDATDRSPWPKAETSALIAWAKPLAVHVTGLLPALLDDIESAAEWHSTGLTVYARDFGAVPLEIVSVEIEGEQMMLPWLGSGNVSNEHEDGANHPIVLLWNPADAAEPNVPIAHAWLDPKSGEPKSRAVRGIRWSEVGLTRTDVLDWLEGLYLNHHLIADPLQLIMQGTLERIAGLDQ